MSIDIHPSCKARLAELIAAALPEFNVLAGKHLDLRSPGIRSLFRANEILPKKGKVHDLLLNYIGENPIFEFIFDTLSDELAAKPSSETELQSITSIEGYENTSSVAERLIEQLDQLPNTYSLTFELPEEVSKSLPPNFDHYDLSPAIRIVRASPELKSVMPIDTMAANQHRFTSLFSALLNPTPCWKENILYLQIEVKGFISSYGGLTPNVNARHTLRSFCGLALGLRLFDISIQSHSPADKRFYFVHSKDVDGRWLFKGQLQIDDKADRSLARLTVNTLGGWIDFTDRQENWSNQILSEMTSVFSEEGLSGPILLASQWYFDSLTGDDELLQYIQAMVVLEILLGDKATSKAIGLNELLRNRLSLSYRQQPRRSLRNSQTIR